MSRLHKALERSTGGRPGILPPGAGGQDGEAPQADQPAFAVPWAINDAEPGRPPRAERPRARARPRRGPPRRLMPPGSRCWTWRLAIALSACPRPGTARTTRSPWSRTRRLAAALHQAQAVRGTRVVLVTSADPGEGKSLTACNLALTLAESYRLRVLLVDADFRRPTLHGVFGGQPLGAAGGGGSLPFGLAAVQASPRLTVLVSGGPVADPTAALTSGALKTLLDSARASFDWVIIDTPPIGLMSDAKLLADMADGAIVVVQAERSPYPDALRAIETLGRERVLGVVLNRLRDVARRYHYYSGYYNRGSRAPGA